MKISKKGQGALEYLMTYGWALLIIVVVGAALYALGVLNPATYTKPTCVGFGYFSFQEQQLQAGGTYTIVSYNGNQDVTITDMDVGGTNATTLVGSPDLTPSATSKVTVIGTGYATNTVGDSFTYEVVITYNTGEITGKTDMATCTGKVE